ncbi:hypothetical protein BDV93DRAFT_99063 [Ceratobasidium sp. AG-I]|nr:hypothetical protein BDV93DRAFT_99063 [Ceratobasidium sp. AG-I]
MCYCSHNKISSTTSTMSEDIEQSESSEQSSVQSDHSASAFFGWAQQDSRLVPAWIYDEGSPQYNRCRITNQHLIPYISSFRASLICSENVDLNRDTERLLPQVLRVVTNYQYLAKPGVPPSEADRGHAMDTLGFDLWDLLSSGDLQYRFAYIVRVCGRAK